MAGKGRPLLKLDENAIANYARLGCSFRDIALLVECNEEVLRRRYKKLIGRARAERRASIHKMQWDSAKGKDGTLHNPPAPANVTMQIWLGKNELGQQDKHLIKNTGTIRHKHSAAKSLVAKVEGDPVAADAAKQLAKRLRISDVN